ncbi:hypothetical protein AMTRI_Chr10g232150 [Amborella trichopoda]
MAFYSNFNSLLSISVPYSGFSLYKESFLTPHPTFSLYKTPFLCNSISTFYLRNISVDKTPVLCNSLSLFNTSKSSLKERFYKQKPDKRAYELNSEVSPHRAVSAVRLLRIEEGGAFADQLGWRENEMVYVERTLGFRVRELDDRNIRLVTEIVGGAVRWRRYLDFLIGSLCSNAETFRGMEPLLLQILRIGVYEIVKLEMPPYAVVDENVTLAKNALRPGAGNFVNAILRKLLSQKERNLLPVPEIEGTERTQARALATLYSHPVWMVRRWINHFGKEEAVRLMNWNNSEPSFSLRANGRKGITRTDLVLRLETLKVPHEPSLHMDDFVQVKTGMQIVIQKGLLKDGLCAVQDESAGLVVSVVDPKPGESIVDCCAAPGGKALFMASYLQGQGKVIAIDINKGRLQVLWEAAKLQDVDDVIRTVHADLRDFARADLRWNRRLEDLEQLKDLQDELLDAASMLVRPGGVLVYSTCSIDPEENADRVAAFLLRHPEFTVSPVDKFVPNDFVTEEGFFLSNPVRHSLDGSFAARLIHSFN